MKIQPILDSINPNQFINDYLSICGVKDVDAYLHSDLSICDSPWDYPNMMIGVNRLKTAIDNDEHIGIIQDPDHDGVSSATVIYKFIKQVNSAQKISVFIHKGKQHGIVQSKEEDLLQSVIDADIDLLICPDSASNDAKQCHDLKANNIDTLILDHHEITSNNPDAIVINHHLGKNLNINLSGCGVTFKFVQACAESWDIDIGDEFYDLVASSLATDNCSMTSPENYALTKYGFAHLTNPMLIAMYDKFNRRGNCPEGVSWGLGPQVNAVVRGGTMEDKEKLFRAFVGEGDIDEAIEIANERHKEQGTISTKLARDIKKEMDCDHKVLVGFSTEEYKNYSGLVANHFTGEYNKPTLILRPLNSTMWSGSLRSPVEIADKINDTGFAKCQGHLSACGIFLKKSNLKKLVNWFDQTDLDMEPCKIVAAKIEPKDITVQLCDDCKNNSMIWGQDIPKPVFYLNLTTNPNEVIVYAKRTKTVKLQYGDVEVMKFRAKAEDVEMLTNSKCNIECIVTLETNEWNGKVSPQAVVSEWNITPIEDDDEDESWEDCF